MPIVNVTVNGRPYPVACDDGQENRIKQLAQYLDGKVADFARSFGQVGEARLLLLAALVIADELAETSEALRQHKVRDVSADTGESAAVQGVVANGIENLAARIEAIAERLETSHIA